MFLNQRFWEEIELCSFPWNRGSIDESNCSCELQLTLFLTKVISRVSLPGMRLRELDRLAVNRDCDRYMSIL